jgi:hypothetical protein
MPFSVFYEYVLGYRDQLSDIHTTVALGLGFAR